MCRLFRAPCLFILITQGGAALGFYVAALQSAADARCFWQWLYEAPVHDVPAAERKKPRRGETYQPRASTPEACAALGKGKCSLSPERAIHNLLGGGNVASCRSTTVSLTTTRSNLSFHHNISHINVFCLAVAIQTYAMQKSRHRSPIER